MTKIDKKKGDSTWKISITSPSLFLPSMEELIYATAGDSYPSIAVFEISGDPDNKLMEIYLNIKPDMVTIKSAISDMAKIFNIEPPECLLKKMADQDWVAQSQKLLKPIDAGRFYLYGDHDFCSIPPGRISILMEAGQAFGTGSHETTKGCLLALDDLANSVMPDTVLDLGCGSGVLAIATAKIWPAKIIATDIDPIATKTTIENLKLNSVARINGHETRAGVAVITSNGFEDSAISSSGPFDLIVANILAEPLRQLAPDIIGNLAEGGSVVLSGLLKEQEISVSDVYEKFGMSVTKTFPINEWQTLVLKKN